MTSFFRLLFLLFMLVFWGALEAAGQVVPPFIQWQNTIGGSGLDQCNSIQQTSDGGYILGGSSTSGISGDKTKASQGNSDYWVLKLAPNGSVEWQNTIGGSVSDELFSIQQTSDGGYILGGASYSNISGDKTDANQGGWDYWVIKLGSTGVIQWQNAIGGSGNDGLYSIQQTNDGGYILGGRSNSGISGEKTDANQGGYDYWVIKLESTGTIQWQNVIGGNNDDNLYSIIQTSDGGYILGGQSTSGFSGDKTEASQGGQDYWVVKLNAIGAIQWQNTIGGNGYEFRGSIIQTIDGGYILGGSSNSGISGDKTEALQGLGDYWVVKLNNSGEIQWQNTIGGSGDDLLLHIVQTSDGGYILGGDSNSGISGDKTDASHGGRDYWVVKLDASGSIQWQNTIGGSGAENLYSIIQATDGGYIFGGRSDSGISGDKTEASQGDYDYWVIKLAPSNYAGTLTLGPLIGQSNDATPDTIFLCRGDSLFINHNGDYDFSGDPIPATPAGIAYAFFDCPPTVSGPGFDLIKTDPCATKQPVPLNGLWLSMASITGDQWWVNNGSLQTFFANGQPMMKWFAPFTADGVDANGGAFTESVQGQPNSPGAHLNKDEAFAIVHLNQIVFENFAQTCDGVSFKLKGGLPEWQPSEKYTVKLFKSGVLKETKTVSAGPVSFSISETGSYSIEVEDGKSCGAVHAFSFGPTSLGQPIAFPPICPPGVNPVDDCSALCVTCENSIDGYLGTTVGFTSGSSYTIPCTNGGITIQNDQWLGFIAGSSSATFSATPVAGTCENGDGLQIAVATDCSDLSTVIACNFGCQGCGSLAQSATISDLAIGQQYFLMVDGWAGDQCQFIISVDPPTATAPPPVGQIATINGPSSTCPGATIEFTTPPVCGASGIEWEIPASAFLNGEPGSGPILAGNTVSIQFQQTGTANVCARAVNPCEKGQAFCKTVQVGKITPTTAPTIVLCIYDCPYEFPDGTLTDCVPGLKTYPITYQNAVGCDSVVNYPVLIKPNLITNLGNKFICKGDSLKVGDEFLNTMGPYSTIINSFQGCDSTIIVNLVVFDPIAQITGGGQLSCTNPSLQLSSQPTQGVKTWTNAAVGTGNSFTVTQPGIYFLTTTITNPTGTCVAKDTTEILSDNSGGPLAIVTAAQTTLTCANPTTVLDATGSALGVSSLLDWRALNGGHFVGQPSWQATVDEGGTYLLILDDPNCPDTAFIVIDEDKTAPGATAIGGMIDCQNPSVTLSGSSPTAGAMFAWTGPNGFSSQMANPTVTFFGTYTLTVTGTNGCTNTATASVTVDQNAPNPAISASDTTVCLGQTVQISAASGAAQYFWQGLGAPSGSNSATFNFTPTVLGQNAYSLTVTNAAGCTSVGYLNIVVVASIAASIDGPQKSCEDAPLTLSAQIAGTATSYIWNPTGQTAQQLTVTPNQPAGALTFSVTVTSTNGCTATATKSVQIIDQPDVAIKPANATICEDSTLVLIAENALVYQWLGLGQTSPTVSVQPTATTEYKIIGTTDPLCPDTATVSVTVRQVPFSNAGMDATVCSPDAVLHAAFPFGADGQWFELDQGQMKTPSDENSVVNNLGKGANRFVWFVENKPCEGFATDTVSIFYENTAPALGNDAALVLPDGDIEIELLKNDTLSGQPNYNIKLKNQDMKGDWLLKPGGVLFFEPNPDSTGTATALYKLCNLVCPDLCDSASVRILISGPIRNNGSGEIAITPGSEDGINDALIFPWLDPDRFPNNEIQIFNRWGSLVHQAKPYKNDWGGTYHGHNLPEGTYFYYLYLNSGNPYDAQKGSILLIRTQ